MQVTCRLYKLKDDFSTTNKILHFIFLMSKFLHRATRENYQAHSHGLQSRATMAALKPIPRLYNYKQPLTYLLIDS